MTYQIRPVKPGDAPALAHIQTESWKGAFRDILAPSVLERCANLEKATAMYARLLDEHKGNGYIGELDEKAHCIAYWDRTREEDMPGYAEIICIHSLPDNWRRGLGGKMMDVLLEDIRKAGYETVMLWVFTENRRARAFYEAKGFTPTDRVKPALGTEEVCYIKKIAP